MYRKFETSDRIDSWWNSDFSDEMIRVLPTWVSHLFIQAVAGTLGGFTTTIITNPLDVVRARLQVQRLDSMYHAFKVLWTEERMKIFTKGLSARLVQSAFFSFSIIVGYETIKRISVKEEYKNYIKWWSWNTESSQFSFHSLFTFCSVCTDFDNFIWMNWFTGNTCT